MGNPDLPKSPVLKANCFSKVVFWWLNGFFSKAAKKELDLTDLYETLPDDKSAQLGNLLAAEWANECERCATTKSSNPGSGDGGKERKNSTSSERPSLWRALSRLFSWRFICMGFLAFLEECVLRIAQPVALGYFVRYFSHKETYEDYVAYVTASILFLTSVLYTFTHHPYFFGVCHIGMQMRVACCSLIYRKALRLSQASLRQTAIGQLVNLLSNDVNRFDTSTIFIHYLWIGPVQTAICTGILWIYFGPSCILGLGLLILFVPLQGYIGSKFSKLRDATATRTDKRIRIMSEIVSGMRVIKMYTWEFPFSVLVGDAREDEIKYIRKTSSLRALNMTLFFTSSKVIVFLTLLLFILAGNQITAELVFVTLALYNNVRLVMTLFFPSAVAMLAETKVSIRRLEDFLLLEERNVQAFNDSFSHVLSSDGGDCGVIVNHICAKWYSDQHDNTLENVSFSVRSGQITGIVGQVGSGKGSVLHAILKELPILEGKIEIIGSVAYVSQEPWLFNGTIKENILFGQPYNESWYERVVNACCLQHDFELFPYGDSTRVGDRGSTMSGGQRARITLARAVYYDADVYLLDDPLSAVDAEVGQHLFEKCIDGILSDKARILVTHQFQFLKTVDDILVMEDGSVKAHGRYQQLEKRGINFEKLSKSMEIAKGRASPSLSTVSHSPPTTSADDVPFSNILHVRSGSLSSRGSGVSRNTLPSPAKKYAPKALVNVAHELSGDHASPKPGRKYKADVADKMEEIPLNEDNVKVVSQQQRPDTKSQESEEAEMLAQGDIPWSLYVNYFRAGSNCCSFTLLVVMNIICQILYSGSDYWLNIWTDAEELRCKGKKAHTDPSDPLYYPYNSWEVQLYGYAVIIILLFITSWIRTLMFFLQCMKSSINLHKNMFRGIIHSPMLFFDTNPTGRILNRFSKDMGQIDDALPPTLFDAAAIFLNVLAIILLIAVVNPLLLIPVIALFIIFYFLRRFYLYAARNVKRLEGSARSPVFSHISTSLYGLTTIRAFNAEAKFIEQFDDHQDLHTSSWYMFLATTRWFGIRLDWISVSYIGVVTFSFLIFSSSGAEVGLAVSSAMLLTGMFQWGIRQSAEVENQMVSVERVMEYSVLKPEAKLESDKDKKPPSGWPTSGKITFDHMYLYYDSNPVLKDVSCTINKFEKIGIVGRTGAGKSSLINVLFRMSEPLGDIMIDGINISEIGLHDLRSKISIIPQEPVLFSGTLRKNLDPFEAHSDSNIWDSLEESHLARDVRQNSMGLEAEVSEGGSNFSVGQRQLLCLARAILRDNRILVLDEATANVDLETDSYIQNTIRTKFKNCTILTIAHRLHTVMDCDRIMVLEAGSIMEFDEPYLLLQNPNSHLSNLTGQAGKAVATNLLEAAKVAHDART